MRALPSCATLVARADSLKIAQRRSQSGYATQLELEQAEAKFHATEQLIPALQLTITRQENGLRADLSLVQVDADHLNAAVNLFQALGGAWSR